MKTNEPPFVDIHCHLAPGIDDGAGDWEQTLQMARIAVDDGIGAIVCTPHQLGAFRHNSGDVIRDLVEDVQATLDDHEIPLEVLPGADVRIEPDMLDLLRSGEVLSLADQRRHVLLELPHELYFPLEDVLERLRQAGMTGILSHPERNQGLLRQRELLPTLVDRGCLMQVTCGSLLGTFGPASQQLGEWMLREGLVHFLATDAHGPRARRPLMRRAHERVCELVDVATADDLCRHYPLAVAQGEPVPAGRRRASGRRGWLPWRRAG